MRYIINLIDTTGLTEKRLGEQSRDDEQILKLVRLCIESHVIYLNAVCFVSTAGKTHEQDTEVFKLKEFLGVKYSNNSMLLLTHCELLPDKKINHFIDLMKLHPPTKEIISFCKLGIFPYGTIDSDFLES